MQIWGGIFIFYFLLLIAVSVLLVYGIAKSNRGMMIPWLACMGIGILFQLIFGLWLLGGYYIYVSFGICASTASIQNVLETVYSSFQFHYMLQYLLFLPITLQYSYANS
jgi:hypothetical protein